mmetsp:Transcript_21720/g.64699  ORF Transcript_21720/g.64699 Transcript_21720/m.64699 type:complete len:221 (+) Transcript_21720:1094-1756(+)
MSAAGALLPPSFSAAPPTGSAQRFDPTDVDPPSAPGAVTQACARKSASSPTVTGMPIGIFSRSCIVMELCMPQPSSGEVHCLLTPDCLSSAPSSSLLSLTLAASLAAPQGSNSQTSARTLLGSDGETTPHANGGGCSSAVAVVLAPAPPSRRIWPTIPPGPPEAPVGAPAAGLPGKPEKIWLDGCGLGCCSPSTVASTACTGSSASTASMRERSGSASKT